MLNNNQQNKAYLIATYQGSGGKVLCEEHLDELELLAQTYGLEVIGKQPCNLRKINASTFLSKGKLQEILTTVQELQVNILLIDEEISPAQQRNLEEMFNIEIMDRTELILGVFAQRARSKEAHLQIELAQAKYHLPRLKRLWTHLSRETAVGGGGGAYLRGMGEKQIEIDKRLLKKRVEVLEKQIDEVSDQREVQRTARKRSGIPTFAIVGYTNTGKSSLLNALTQADVFVEDKLFATLDTTTRKFVLSNKQDVLLIDTVGFIRKLPHLLVASFRSTLEEAFQADFLLHLIDVSHPNAVEQAQASYKVLRELNAEKKPIITVLNKIDKTEDKRTISNMRLAYPKSVPISVKTGEGFADLEEIMIAEINKRRKMMTLQIPQSEYALASEVLRKGHVLKKEYLDNDIVIQAELPEEVAFRLKKYLVKEQ